MNLPAIINPAPQFSMGDVKGIAEAIAKGGLFGSKDPYAVLTLCLLAQAEGQHPAVVFRDYHIISGKPAKKADAMLRDYLAGGGKVEWHTLDDNLADATFSHPAGGSVRISWDAKRVQQAQLGGNAMHKKYPRQMLRARVISEGVRTVYPGATSGLYVPEEAAAFDDGPKASQEPVQALEDHSAPQHAEQVEDKPSRRREPLTWPIKTRAAARGVYDEIVHDLHGCADQDMLDIVLANYADEIDQFERELPLVWKGDGDDFLGLEKEIEAARQRIASPDLTGELLESHRVALEKLHECDTPKRLAVWMEDNQPIIDMADDAARKVMLATYAARCEEVDAMNRLRA